MKKAFSIFFIILMIAAAGSAQSLIEAAKARDYRLFEKALKNGANLNETDEHGMNVQVSLAYFPPEEFKKACTLLHKKGFDFDKPAANNISLLYLLAYSCSHEKIQTLLKYKVDVNRKNDVTGLKPIDATQFSTFKFYSDQIIPPKAFANAEKTRQLLLKHGSQEFKYAGLSFGNVGNFFFCIVNMIVVYYPLVQPDMINSQELFDFSELNGQPQAAVKKESLIELFASMNLNVEINSYTDKNETLRQLIATELSEDTYMLMAQTGNSPLAPYQWVNINGGDYGTNPDFDQPLKVSNPDALYQFVEFKVQDISQLLTFKIKQAERQAPVN